MAAIAMSSGSKPGASNSKSGASHSSSSNPPPPKKRPYQTRRKERSCDNCKLRKTKCDARGNNSCTACINAELDCVFSSTEHEGRKMGPQRKIRDLERTIEDLRAQLEHAMNALNHSRQTGSYTTQSSPEDNVNTAPSDRTSSMSDVPNVRSREGTGSISGPRRSLGESDPVSWNPNAFGPGSAPQFIDSYTEYLQRLGWAANNVQSQQGNIIQNMSQIPLLADLPDPRRTAIDLRIYLPEKNIAFVILEVFRRSVQAFKAPFYWPHLVQKFHSAYEDPMFENDSARVGYIFCPVMMVLAVGSQLVDWETCPVGSGSSETPPDANIPQERKGWKYFEVGRKYLGLNNPVYTLEDAAVLTMMSLYLDKATLPSPCWMICGAMSRVCQDIGLHRRPPPGAYDKIQLEARSRLFWLAFVQDKRVSLKMGRPSTLRAEDCDVPYPGTLEYTGIPQVTTNLDDAGGQPDPIIPMPQGVDLEYYSAHSLQTVNAIILGAKACELISAVKLIDGADRDMAILTEIDQKLQQHWDQLPAELRDYNKPTPLDTAATRSLFIIQHARLILFRYFTDFSSSLPISAKFRTFCLEESIRVSKITARILYRSQLNRDFTAQFGVRNDDLVHLHVFRVAVNLLWGIQYTRSTSRLDEMQSLEEDLQAALVALQAIARVHVTGKRFLNLYKSFAELMNHPTVAVPIPVIQSQQNNNPDYEAAADFPRTSEEWVSQSVFWQPTTTYLPIQSDTAYAPPLTLPNPLPGPNPVLPNSEVPPAPINSDQATMAAVSQGLEPATIMNQVTTGNWSGFEDMLHWNPDFESYVAGGNIWNFHGINVPGSSNPMGSSGMGEMVGVGRGGGDAGVNADGTIGNQNVGGGGGVGANMGGAETRRMM